MASRGRTRRQGQEGPPAAALWGRDGGSAGGEAAAGGGPRIIALSGVAGILRRHPLPVLFGCGLLLFMGVEYTIPMIPAAASPLDLGFHATAAMHAGIAARPWLNSLLAALNTLF
ncbi:hypothetical protein ZWY2020_056358 [Hordeum vulgare]|nr:hypothetical protein ZWY2020_056358 [Hordeum vulgare]